MADYIYTRISTTKQTHDPQTDELAQKFPDARIVKETSSGAKQRPILERLISSLGEGDRIIVAALDRLGRRTSDILAMLEYLDGKGVGLISLREGVDYSDPVGRLVLQILASVSEMERSLISERTRAGLVAARNAGVRLGAPKGHKYNVGRRKSYTESEPRLVKQIYELQKMGMSSQKIALAISAGGSNISQSKVWRILKREKSMVKQK